MKWMCFFFILSKSLLFASITSKPAKTSTTWVTALLWWSPGEWWFLGFLRRFINLLLGGIRSEAKSCVWYIFIPFRPITPGKRWFLARLFFLSSASWFVRSFYETLTESWRLLTSWFFRWRFVCESSFAPSSFTVLSIFGINIAISSSLFVGSNFFSFDLLVPLCSLDLLCFDDSFVLIFPPFRLCMLQNFIFKLLHLIFHEFSLLFIPFLISLGFHFVHVV